LLNVADEPRLTLKDLSQWVDNDEGLYRWWKSEGGRQRDFIVANRAAIERCVRNVLSGARPAHYLYYGH
jgi:hypothetical protein